MMLLLLRGDDSSINKRQTKTQLTPNNCDLPTITTSSESTYFYHDVDSDTNSDYDYTDHRYQLEELFPSLKNHNDLSQYLPNYGKDSTSCIELHQDFEEEDDLREPDLTMSSTDTGDVYFDSLSSQILRVETDQEGDSDTTMSYIVGPRNGIVPDYMSDRRYSTVYEEVLLNLEDMDRISLPLCIEEEDEGEGEPIKAKGSPNSCVTSIFSDQDKSNSPQTSNFSTFSSSEDDHESCLISELKKPSKTHTLLRKISRTFSTTAVSAPLQLQNTVSNTSSTSTHKDLPRLSHKASFSRTLKKRFSLASIQDQVHLQQQSTTTNTSKRSVSGPNMKTTASSLIPRSYHSSNHSHAAIAPMRSVSNLSQSQLTLNKKAFAAHDSGSGFGSSTIEDTIGSYGGDQDPDYLEFKKLYLN